MIAIWPFPSRSRYIPDSPTFHLWHFIRSSQSRDNFVTAKYTNILFLQGRRHISLIPTSFSLPNVTFRKSKKSPQKTLPIRVSPRYSSALKIDNGRPATEDDDDTHTGALYITESEWMCRTPSPVRNDPEYSYIERKLWSPGLDLEDKHRSHVQREVERDVHSELSFDFDSREEEELMNRERERERDNEHTEEDVRSSSEEDLDEGFVAKTEVEEQIPREGNWI
jgi:hypothetical protein